MEGGDDNPLPSDMEERIAYFEARFTKRLSGTKRERPPPQPKQGQDVIGGLKGQK